MNKSWTKPQIKANLLLDDRWLIRGMLAIYDRQTEVEKGQEQTIEENGVGFNGVDAGILSSFSRQVRERGWLSAKQMEIARKLMPKYSGQLVRIANKEI